MLLTVLIRGNIRRQICTSGGALEHQKVQNHQNLKCIHDWCHFKYIKVKLSVSSFQLAPFWCHVGVIGGDTTAKCVESLATHCVPLSRYFSPTESLQKAQEFRLSQMHRRPKKSESLQSETQVQSSSALCSYKSRWRDFEEDKRLILFGFC